MSKKSNYKYERFIVDDPPEEMYGWKYGVDNSKTMYDTHKGQRAAVLKSPYSVYLLALIVFMLFWFAYSFVNAVKTKGGTVVLLQFLPSFFVLAVCSAIVILSVFGMWGKFARWALKKKSVAGNPDTNKLQAEIEAADANKGRENALNIFEDYIEIINYGVRQVLNRNLLKCVILKKRGGYCTAEFVSIYGLSIYANAEIPSADVHLIKEIFGEICSVEKRRRSKIKDEALPFYHVKEKFKIDGAKIGGLVMGFICAAAGGGVIALHYCVNKSIPMPLGLFFIAGGFLAMLTVFDNVDVIKIFGIPFVFGVIFTGFPFMFIFSVAQSEGIKVTLPTFHEFLCSFSPLLAGMFFMAGMGVLLIIVAFVQLIKYLKNR